MIGEKRAPATNARCTICPQNCMIKPGASGICGVRGNDGSGSVHLTKYGSVSGYGTDPIEKKPLYHFYPGSKILSVGSFGCNLRCDFCQNSSISQSAPSHGVRRMMPSAIVAEACLIPENRGVAFTYNEPVVWFEFMRDIALLAKAAQLKTVVVSNGYVNQSALEEMIAFTDAFNIDLKFFNNDSYKKYTGGTLGPVLNSIREIAKAGRHIEITTLVIPGLNDSADEISAMASWIATEIGADTPLHLSRYFPSYHRRTPATKTDTLKVLKNAASNHLDYVYTGNTAIPELNCTMCPDCGTTVTNRKGYDTEILNLSDEGNCTMCGKKIYRYFTSPW
jgi:pyruvate formate lyase activating enzyme